MSSYSNFMDLHDNCRSIINFKKKKKRRKRKRKFSGKPRRIFQFLKLNIEAFCSCTNRRKTPWSAFLLRSAIFIDILIYSNLSSCYRCTVGFYIVNGVWNFRNAGAPSWCRIGDRIYGSACVSATEKYIQIYCRYSIAIVSSISGEDWIFISSCFCVLWMKP